MKKVLILFLLIAWSGNIFSQCYTVAMIPYNPSADTGTVVPVNDDQYSLVIPIGFTFCFYGGMYDKLVIGSNGVVSFDTTHAGGYCTWPIPVNFIPGPWAAIILFPWNDLFNPQAGSALRYALYGTSPNRTFVVSVDSTSMFSCFSMRETTQLILFESTNVIEVHIHEKPICPGWNGGRAVLGIQNSLGNMAVVAASGQWTAADSAWRFTPSCDVCNAIGISEIPGDENFISLFPNPATNQTIISSRHPDASGAIKEIEIFDVVGVCVKALTPDPDKIGVVPSPSGEGSATIDVSQLTPGIYFVRVRGEKNSSVIKLVKL
jgi:hypothetical protein